MLCPIPWTECDPRTLNALLSIGSGAELYRDGVDCRCVRAAISIDPLPCFSPRRQSNLDRRAREYLTPGGEVRSCCVRDRARRANDAGDGT